MMHKAKRDYRGGGRWLFAATALAAATVAGGASAQTKATGFPAQVKTDKGIVSGTASARPNVRAFLGIPFAAPPVGALRWKAPAPVAAWSGIRKADAFGASCMQIMRSQSAGGQAFSVDTRAGTAASEDCLSVNVWTPAKAANAKLPVMVWIYGGGFNAGSSSVPIYNGEGLAAKDVVVVSLNYRLGIFGFLAHPELDRESARGTSGNYGILDQVAALEWVKRNIASFGGDPGRVTIFGQSAGGGSVNFLSISPLAKGLFQAAISQNGTLASRDPYLQERSPIAYKTMAQAEADNAAYLTKSGVQSLAQLRSMTSEQIATLPPAPFPPAFYTPVVDGWAIPDNFTQAYAKREQSDVPFMAGWTSSYYPEFKIGLADYRKWAKDRFGALADRYLALYPASTDEEAARQVDDATRDSYRASIFLWAQERQGKNPTYLWFFNHPLPGPDARRLGARAGHDIPYVLDSLHHSTRPIVDEDRALAEIMSSYWANFGKTGNPNGSRLPQWPAYRPDRKIVMQLGDNPGPIAAADDAKVEFYRDFFATSPTCAFAAPCSIAVQ